MGRIQGIWGGGQARKVRVIVEVPQDVNPRVWLAWTSHVHLIPTRSIEVEDVPINAIVLEPGEFIIVELWECVGSHCDDVGCWSGGSIGMRIVGKRRWVGGR